MKQWKIKTNKEKKEEEKRMITYLVVSTVVQITLHLIF